MTKEEATKFFDEQKANGMSEEEILAVLYKMYQDDKIDLDQLEALCAVMGYEFTDEFKNMSEEDKKTKGIEEAGDDEDEAPTKEVEEKSEEVEDEFDESEEDEDDDNNASAPAKDGEDEDDDEDEEKKAKKLFGLN